MVNSQMFGKGNASGIVPVSVPHTFVMEPSKFLQMEPGVLGRPHAYVVSKFMLKGLKVRGPKSWVHQP